MSSEHERADTNGAAGFGTLRRPGDPTHDSITTTQTNCGLASGDPAGGPHRTPERRAIDDERGREPRVKSGRDPDLKPTDASPRTPEDVNATPPHGDKLDER
jgi:hypothetical protein